MPSGIGLSMRQAKRDARFVAVTSECSLRSRFAPIVLTRAKSYLRRIYDATLRASTGPVFATPLVVHWGLHKGMTGYYTQVMLQLRKQTGLLLSAHYADTSGVDVGISAASDARTSVVLLSDLLDYRVGEGVAYRGSITLREPRDLIVSGYNYHLNTNESWVHDRAYDWSAIGKEDSAADLLGGPPERWRGKSYGEVLRSLEKEEGLILEILRVSPVLRSYRFANEPGRLRIDYEDILGAEVDAFLRLFDHYGLQPAYRPSVLKTVEQLSAKNQQGKSSHIRNPTSGKWKGVLTDKHLDLLSQRFGAIFEKAGYSL